MSHDPRKGDVLVATRLSRMARSVRNLTEVAADLEHRGVTLKASRPSD